MKLSAITVGLLALLTPLTAAWTKEDREIFRVRDELIAHEGPDVTFYDFLGVSRSASLDDINKAYKKKSRQLHPDKVRQQLTAERLKAQKDRAKQQKGKGKGKGGQPGAHVARPPTAAEIRAAVKRAEERQARLSIVADVLRGPGRDRYDHFLTHGFPAWKGTGYYYSRYRPGLGTAVTGVFLFAGGAAHYLALYMGWKRRREFVERYIRFARHAAWGENLGIPIPGVDGPGAAPLAAAAAAAPPQQPDDRPDEEARAVPVNRKMRRMQERDARREAGREAQSSGGGRRARRAPRPSPSASSGSATPQPQAAGGSGSGSGSGPTGSKKRVVAENGKVLIVDSLGDVYLEEVDEDGNVAEYLLDPSELPRPTFKDTAVIRLPLWVFRTTVGRLVSKRTEEDSTQEGDGHAAEAEALDNDDEDSEPGRPTPSTGSAEDFELLEKSVDELGQARASGNSPKRGGKATKRKNKKR